MPIKDPDHRRQHYRRYARRQRAERRHASENTECFVCGAVVSVRGIAQHEAKAHPVPEYELFRYHRGNYVFIRTSKRILVRHAFLDEEDTIATGAQTVTGIVRRCDNWLWAHHYEQLSFEGILEDSVRGQTLDA